jgi:hypothetical protein
MGINRFEVKSKGGDPMTESTFQFFANQGPWALLFVILLYWVLRENSKREEKLIKCLDAIVPQLDAMSRDIGEIKDQLSERR